MNVWKYVYNSSLHVAGLEKEKIIEIVKKTGYLLYSWNGEIFHITGVKMPFNISEFEEEESK